MTADMVRAYADASNDHNPIDLDKARGGAVGLGERAVHGMFVIGLIEPALGLWNLTGQIAEASARFLFPLLVGERLKVTPRLEAAAKPKAGPCVSSFERTAT